MTEFGSLRRTDWLLFSVAVAIAFLAYLWRRGVPSAVDALFVGIVLLVGGGILYVGTRLVQGRT